MHWLWVLPYLSCNATSYSVFKIAMLVYIIHFAICTHHIKKNNLKLKDIAQLLRHSDPVAGNDLQPKRMSYRRQYCRYWCLSVQCLAWTTLHQLSVWLRAACFTSSLRQHRPHYSANINYFHKICTMYVGPTLYKCYTNVLCLLRKREVKWSNSVHDHRHQCSICI